MIAPSWILAVLIGSMIGLAFYYAFGRKTDNMFVSWLVGVGAFLVGQAFGSYRPVAPFLLGEVHILEGAIASVLALAAAHLARR
jgi:Na+-transporting NADH:ubiquinone oxidoreductase subunit NqrB